MSVKRGSDGRILSSCSCKLHDADAEALCGNKRPKAVDRLSAVLKQKLSLNKLLNSENSKNICEVCLKNVQNGEFESKDSYGTTLKREEIFLLERLMASLENEKADYVKLLASSPSDFSDLTTYSPSRWLAKRPPSPVFGVKLLCGYHSGDVLLEQDYAKVAYIIECMDKEQRNHLVLPLSFIINLTAFLTTRCQFNDKVISKLSPGSFNRLSKWVTRNTQSPLEPSTGDLKTMQKWLGQ